MVTAGVTGQGSTPLWQPTAQQVAATNLDRFRRDVEHRHGVALANSTELHRWSIANLGPFWSTVWDAVGVVGDQGQRPITSGDIRSTRFFPDAQLNAAETLLRGPADGTATAIEFYREDGLQRRLTWNELREEVAATAAALRAEGVSCGDRVAAWMANCPETMILMAATWSIGAVFSSTSPDFGTTGVLDRFGQIMPKVLVGVDGYRYGGRPQDCSERLSEIAAQLPSVTRTVVVPFLESPRAAGAGIDWAEWLAPYRAVPLRFDRFGFDHPGLILYSSGTTGAPKCIVHRAAGVVLKHLQEQQHQCDVRAKDRVLYFTTCGWMMWNWLASALGSAATVILYDGSPVEPSPAVLFDIAERYRVTLFGTSAKFLDSARKAGLTPRETHDLSSLRTICSTGSPLVADGFHYVYDAIATNVHLASISGGTDLCGCFVTGDPTRPVWAGDIQGPALGMDVDVFDSAGVPAPVDEKGELVCKAAFPTVPVGFWGDDDGSRFGSAYFDRFPGVWAHGDFAAWTEHGGMVIYGRSDAVLNAGGVRIGTAEIYRIVERFDEIVEAIAVGQDWDGDTRIVLFVRLAAGASLDQSLMDALKRALRERASPRHVPARILAVTDVPRTRSGKIVELAVGDIVNGRAVRNTDALANPEALAQYAGRPELLV